MYILLANIFSQSHTHVFIPHVHTTHLPALASCAGPAVGAIVVVEALVVGLPHLDGAGGVGQWLAGAALR